MCVHWATGDWPTTIAQLLGAKSLPLLHGEQHRRVRKTMVPAFGPKVGVAYIPPIVDLAQRLCAEWAEAGHIKGVDSMKAFTFQVSVKPKLVLRSPS